MVSTERCIAALEMICDGVSGKIVPVEREDLLSQSIRLCTENCSEMAQAALEEAKGYTIEAMARKHLDCWSEMVF